MTKFLFEPLKAVRRGIIVDTDMGPDCDDVGGLALTYFLAKKYHTKVLAVMAASSSEYSPACIDAINNFCDFPDVPIGKYKKDGLFEDQIKYNKYIGENFSKAYKEKTLKVYDAVELYRRILADSPSKSVIITCLGPLVNIRDLMDSPPDAISPYTGKELLENKVYSLVCMGGKYPEGLEFNISQDPTSAKKVFEELDIPVIFSDFDLGSSIITGYKNFDEANHSDNPIFMAYKLFSHDQERPSFDLTAVHFAFYGTGEYYKLKGPLSIDINLEKDGYNRFVDNDESKQYLMVKNKTDLEIAHMLNNMLHSFN